MSGLYQKALDYLHTRSPLRLVTADESDYEEPHISAEDQESINAQIEKVLEQHKMQIDDDTFKVDAERRGGFLPVLVNIVAVLLVAGGFFAALYYFDKKEQEVSLGRRTIISAESRLLDTMAAESERRLSAKNNEISSIQRDLASMISERQAIKTSAEERFRTREEELRTTLGQQLEDERARLGENGLSPEALSERMSAFEAELQSGFASKLEEAANQADRELEAQENTLNTLIHEYEQSLEAAETERTDLARDLEARRVTLEKELAESETQRAGQRASFDRQLQTMQDQQAREQLVLDQLLALYAAIEADISSGQLVSARERIGELRGYLDDTEIIQLPMMRNRRQVELFLADSLDSLVELEIKGREIDTAALIESANTISSVIALVEEGNALVERGDFSAAREKYVASFNRIPALMDGFNSVEWIDERLRLQELTVIEDLVGKADTSFLAGGYQEAIDLYSRALDAGIIERVSQAGYLLKRTQDLAMLESARIDLEEALEREGSLAELNQQQIDIILARDDQLTRLEELTSAQADRMGAAIDRVRTDLESAEREIDRLEQFETAAAERDRIAAYVADYSKRYEESIDYSFVSDDSGRQESESDVLTLLETKLVIVTIINSEAVQAEYPGLSARMNDYLAALILENAADIQNETLTEVIGFIDEFNRGTLSAAVPAAAARHGGEQSRLVAEFLRKLALLLR